MSNLEPREPYRPLRWTDTVYEIQALVREVDFDAPVYIVGGAVRDALYGREIQDLDLATAGDAILLAKMIANRMPKGALFVMDAERGVARAIIEVLDGEMHVDVAQFRAGGDDLLADLTDRDFTVNAMAVDLKGDIEAIIDPLNGQADMNTRTIRRCGVGVVQRDPVRALRAIRLSRQLNFRIERETLTEVRETVGSLGQISTERVRDEFFKILDLERPAAALRVMDALGLLDEILGLNAVSDRARREYLFMWLDKLAQLLRGLRADLRDSNIATDFGYGMALMQVNAVRSQLEAHLAETWANDRSHWAVLMLVGLVQDFGVDGIEKLAEGLRLSNPEKKRMVAIFDAWGWIMGMDARAVGALDALEIHRFWYPLKDAGVDVCLITLAEHLAKSGVALSQDEWLLLVQRIRILLEAYYLEYETLVEPEPLVDGRMLMDALDIEPGSFVGELLTQIREAQVLGVVRTVDDALALAAGSLKS